MWIFRHKFDTWSQRPWFQHCPNHEDELKTCHQCSKGKQNVVLHELKCSEAIPPLTLDSVTQMVLSVVKGLAEILVRGGMIYTNLDFPSEPVLAWSYLHLEANESCSMWGAVKVGSLEILPREGLYNSCPLDQSHFGQMPHLLSWRGPGISSFSCMKPNRSTGNRCKAWS